MQLPPSTERVPRYTSDYVNERIRRNTAERLRHYGEHPGEIDDRLTELDREWDIERTLEANAAGVILSSFALARIKRRVLVLPIVVAAFLLQHALQGWCPPVPLFRRMGVRTRQEIEAERTALLAIRQGS